MDCTDKELQRLQSELDIARSSLLRREEELNRKQSVLKAVFAVSRDFIAFKDRDMVYRKVNPAFAAFLGKSEDEIIGNTDEFLFSPDIAALSVAINARVMDTLKPEDSEWQIIGTTGPLWLHVSITPVLDNDGAISGVLCSARDVTERKQAELELQRFFDLVPDLLCLGSVDGSFRKLNDSWQKALGYTQEELLKISYYELIHPEDRELTKCEISRLSEGHKTLNFVNRYRTKNGSYRWLEWSASPAVGGEFYAIARDITERIIAEKKTRLWADAFNYCSHGISVGDPATGKFLTCNLAYARLHGMTIGEITGKPILDLYPDSQKDAVRRSVDKAEKEGYTRFESIKNRKDGTEFPVQVDVVSVHDESDLPLYQIVTIEDLSTSRASETALRESEARFRSVVEFAPEAIFIQTGGCFAYLNPSAIDLYGASSEDDLMGRPVLERVHPDSRQMVSERIRTVNDEHFAVPLKETKYLRCDGSSFYVEASAVPFVYNEKQGALVFVRDISKRKEAEATKAKLEQQLFQSQKMDSIGRLAGGIAHDLNNMLTPIIGYSEMLLDQFSRDDKRLSSVEGIHNAGLRSRDLVHQLLAFSRRQAMVFKVLDLNSVLRNFDQLLRRTIRENITIHYTLFPGHLAINGDIGQIEQIIMNLAVNAQDSMPEGGEIVIKTSMTVAGAMDSPLDDKHQDAVYVSLSICDTGSGMDAETISHIFEPFYSTKKRSRGTGLGLATVYGIVHQHGGNITVLSSPGKGSTFTVNFPLEKALPDIVAEAVKPEQSLSKSQSSIILVVEDNMMVRKFIIQALQLEHLHVLEASSGEEALRLLDEQLLTPDLLMTDVIMPGMNGKELFDVLRKRYPDLKVLYMSGYMQNVIIQHGVDERETAFLQKPFSVDAMFIKVRELLDDARN
jgi:two-component system, cell cycle sensor histidine kinase and response regulator CckA